MNLNREILRLAVPSIIANVTVPVVGMVAIAVVGHLGNDGIYDAAMLIGGISIGSMLFDLMYWNFGFLRTGTGGLTAQAFGRGDNAECANLFIRAESIALLSAFFLIAIRSFVLNLSLAVVDASAEVEYLASCYFNVRVWAAPATLSLMAIKGWLIGMQDGVSPMVTDIVVNVVNVVASLVLTLGIHSPWVEYAGIGFIGVARATVIAQYTGFATGMLLILFKYGKVFRSIGRRELRTAFSGDKIRLFFRTNADLFVRSLCFIGIYIGFTTIAASYDDLVLATSSIMMQLMMLFSYITDGFAYAGEALVGRFTGSGDIIALRRTSRRVFIWSFGITFAFLLLYWFYGDAMIALLTSDTGVQSMGHRYLVWLTLMPIVGCSAFTWDGIYTGAADTRDMRNSMLLSTLAYFGLYFAFNSLLNPTLEPTAGLHILLAAYCMHLVVRTVYLSITYRRGVLGGDRRP